MFRELGISNDDQILMTDDFNYEEGLIQMGLDRRDAQGRLTPVYHLPLTKKMYDTLTGNKKLISRIVMEPEDLSGQMSPAKPLHQMTQGILRPYHGYGKGIHLL